MHSKQKILQAGKGKMQRVLQNERGGREMKKKRKAKKLGHYVLAGVLGYGMSYLFKLDNKKQFWRNSNILRRPPCLQQVLESGCHIQILVLTAYQWWECMDTDATVSIDTGLDTLTISWSHFTLRSYVPVSNFLFFFNFSDFAQQKCFIWNSPAGFC